MRTMPWLMLCAALFAAGLVLGKRWGEQPPAVVVEPAPPVRVAPRPEADDVLRVDVPGFAEAVAARDWDALIALLESASFENRDEEHQALYNGMRQVAADLAAAGAIDDVSALLGGFAALNPQDHDVRFALARALQDNDRFAEALEPTFEILDAPLTFEAREQAERLRDDLIQAEAERLEAVAREEGEPATDALITLYENLALREPVNDRHRAALVAVYLAAGQVDAAADTFDAMAGYGVSPESIEALEAEIALQRAGPGISKRGGGLYATVDAGAVALNLLLDTGATQTALTPAALASVRALPLNRSVRVQTAGGEVVAPVFQVAQFNFAGTAFTDLEVIALPNLPSAIDGLLGMDVLNQVGELELD